jgi:long-chain acyl-CoA synthetase
MPFEINTLREMVEQVFLKYREATAFQIKKNNLYRQYSFGLVYELISSLAAELRNKGVNFGDRVAILSENRPEWGIAYLATACLGAVAIPLDAMLIAEEMHNLLADSGSKVILISKALVERHPNLHLTKILMEEVENLKGAASLPRVEVKRDDLAAIVYTSGTTGIPKGVMLTHGNIASNILAIARLFDIGPGDNFLSVLPMHHTFETTAGFLGPFHMGACITYAESLKSYNIVKNMQETGVTIMNGVPLLWNLFYDAILREVEEKGWVGRMLFASLTLLARALPPEPVRRRLFAAVHKKMGGKIRFFVSGGAAIDPEIIYGFGLFGITILQGYGLTESAPILTCCTLKRNRVGSVGQALHNVEIKITSEGEIIARGPNIMKGYYKRPDLTTEVLKGGWLYTGDVGRIDKEGYVFITGRIKDIIVTGSGVNVYPDEIEFFLNKMPGIKESCVLGVRVAEGLRRGMEEVWAIVVPDYEYFEKHRKHADQALVEGAIQEEVNRFNQRLAEYKRVAKLKIRSIELPKTTTRKVRRFQVRKEMGL